MRNRGNKSGQIFWGTGDTEVCRSYEVQVIQKCADLMRYRWYRSLQNLWGTGDTRVCRCYEVQMIKKCAGLMRDRWYTSAYITGNRPAACVSHLPDAKGNGLQVHQYTKRWSQDTLHFSLQTQSNGKVNTFRRTQQSSTGKTYLNGTFSALLKKIFSSYFYSFSATVKSITLTPALWNFSKVFSIV